MCASWRESREQTSHEGWEQTRWLGTMMVQPHVRRSLSPRDVLKLPWEEEIHRMEPRMSKEERERRMADAIRRMGARL